MNSKFQGRKRPPRYRKAKKIVPFSMKWNELQASLNRAMTSLAQAQQHLLQEEANLARLHAVEVDLGTQAHSAAVGAHRKCVEAKEAEPAQKLAAVITRLESHQQQRQAEEQMLEELETTNPASSSDEEDLVDETTEVDPLSPEEGKKNMEPLQLLQLPLLPPHGGFDYPVLLYTKDSQVLAEYFRICHEWAEEYKNETGKIHLPDVLSVESISKHLQSKLGCSSLLQDAFFTKDMNPGALKKFAKKAASPETSLSDSSSEDEGFSLAIQERGRILLPGKRRSFRKPGTKGHLGKRRVKRLSSSGFVAAHQPKPSHIEPSKVLCPYDLHGTCNDLECKWQHLPSIQESTSQPSCDRSVALPQMKLPSLSTNDYHPWASNKAPLSPLKNGNCAANPMKGKADEDAVHRIGIEKDEEFDEDNGFLMLPQLSPASNNMSDSDEEDCRYWSEDGSTIQVDVVKDALRTVATSFQKSFRSQDRLNHQEDRYFVWACEDSKIPSIPAQVLEKYLELENTDADAWLILTLSYLSLPDGKDEEFPSILHKKIKYLCQCHQNKTPLHADISPCLRTLSKAFDQPNGVNRKSEVLWLAYLHLFCHRADSTREQGLHMCLQALSMMPHSVPICSFASSLITYLPVHQAIKIYNDFIHSLLRHQCDSTNDAEQRSTATLIYVLLRKLQMQYEAGGTTETVTELLSLLSPRLAARLRPASEKEKKAFAPAKIMASLTEDNKMLLWHVLLHLLVHCSFPMPVFCVVEQPRDEAPPVELLRWGKNSCTAAYLSLKTYTDLINLIKDMFFAALHSIQLEQTSSQSDVLNSKKMAFGENAASLSRLGTQILLNFLDFKVCICQDSEAAFRIAQHYYKVFHSVAFLEFCSEHWMDIPKDTLSVPQETSNDIFWNTYISVKRLFEDRMRQAESFEGQDLLQKLDTIWSCSTRSADQEKGLIASEATNEHRILPLMRKHLQNLEQHTHNAEAASLTWQFLSIMYTLCLASGLDDAVEAFSQFLHTRLFSRMPRWCRNGLWGAYIAIHGSNTDSEQSTIQALKSEFNMYLEAKKVNVQEFSEMAQLELSEVCSSHTLEMQFGRTVLHILQSYFRMSPTKLQSVMKILIKIGRVSPFSCREFMHYLVAATMEMLPRQMLFLRPLLMNLQTCLPNSPEIWEMLAAWEAGNSHWVRAQHTLETGLFFCPTSSRLWTQACMLISSLSGKGETDIARILVKVNDYNVALPISDKGLQSGLNQALTQQQQMCKTTASILGQRIKCTENRLKCLALERMLLADVPKCVFLFSKTLLKLSLANNQIRKLPRSIFNLAQLQSFDVSKNLLDGVPDEITSMKALQQLNISHNKIQSLPDEIGDLWSLKELRAGFNRLEVLPKTVTKLCNLEVLELHYNFLSTLPSQIGTNLSKIIHLKIDHNLFY